VRKPIENEQNENAEVGNSIQNDIPERLLRGDALVKRVDSP
jgi:hypothetical protein